MRDDLLDAKANIDWAISQFPSFEERITEWLDNNVYVCTEELPPPSPNNVVVAVEKEPFPLSFNVEVGAYINVIRSSLDMLAVSVGRRYSILFPENIYFPVAASSDDFVAGNHKGGHLIRSLPADARHIFENLKPYDGGNPAIWTLHHLDIVRKHRRLIGVEIIPRDLSITGTASLGADIYPIGADKWLDVNEKTVLFLVRKGAARYEVQFTAHIAFSEAGDFYRKPVTWALPYFARRVSTIISLFDDV